MDNFFLPIKNLKLLYKNIIKKITIIGRVKILFKDNSKNATLKDSKNLLNDIDVSFLKKKISKNTFGNLPMIGKLHNKKKIENKLKNFKILWKDLFSIISWNIFAINIEITNGRNVILIEIESAQNKASFKFFLELIDLIKYVINNKDIPNW